MTRRFRTLLVFLVILLGAVAFLKGWIPAFLQKPSVVRLPPGALAGSTPRVGEEALPIAVRTFKASRIEFTDLLPALGTIRGQKEIPLKFEVNGMIKKIEFREGDIVSEGQTLASLDDKDARLRLEYSESKLATAKAQLALSEKRFSINDQLFKIGAIIRAKLEESQAEVEQARTQVATAEKEVELAQSELTKTVLRAPMEGVIGTKEVEEGQYYTVQSPPMSVATLMDVQSVYVELGIIERDIEKIRLSQRVKVTVDSLPNATFEGTIDNLAPLIEGKSRTLTAKVKVENPKGQLLPGMFARAEIAVFEKPNALVVPTSALKDADGDGKFESVFVVEADAAVSKPVTLGYLTTDYAEITEGIQEAEQVVTEARGALKNGSKVVLLETEEAGIERSEPASVKGKEEEGPR